MSSNRMIALGVVAIIHALLGYAFVTGLAQKAVKAIAGPLQAVNHKEVVPPPDEPPPPPPREQEIPPYVPPPEFSIQQDAPPPPTITAAPKPTAPTTAITAPVAEKPPGTPARVKGNRAKLFSTDDYPPSSLRREEAGRVVARFDVNEKGRVENCVVTTSVSADLDRATCRLFEARLRYEPATENGVPIRATGKTDAITWKIPTDR